IGSVKPDGSIDVPLRKTTEFTLIAKNDKGESASSSTTVMVSSPPPEPKPGVTAAKTPPEQHTQQQPPPPPAQPPAAPPAQPPPVVHVRPEIAFTAVPSSIQQGGFAVLRWYLTNTDSAYIEPSPGILRQATGEVRVAPAQTTTY